MVLTSSIHWEDERRSGGKNMEEDKKNAGKSLHKRNLLVEVV